MNNNMALSIEHIALLVKDLVKAEAFYTKALGLKKIDRPDFFIKGLWYQLGQSQLHLMLCENSPKPHIHPLNETVQPHFSIRVSKDYFTKIILQLKACDIELIGDVEVNSFNVKQAFFYDPDNNMLEINTAA